MEQIVKAEASVFRSALVGALLSLGAPIGWLLYEWLVKQTPPVAAIGQARDLYLYVTISTAIVFTLFGLAHGMVMRRLTAAVVDLAHAKNALEHIARSDMVTGLPNAKAFFEVTGLFAGHANRHGEHVAVLVIGVEKHRQITVSHGVPTADRHLRNIAGLLTHDRRHEDYVARIGAREFAVLLPGAGCAEAEKVAQRIEEAAADSPAAKETGIELSFGITEFGALDDARSLIGRAETALQQARRLKDTNRLSLLPLRAAAKGAR